MEAIVDRWYPGGWALVEPYLDGFAKDPQRSIEQPAFLDLVTKGALRSPSLDLAKVRRLHGLLSRKTLIGRDDRVEVRLLTPEQVRATPPEELTR